MSSVPVNVDAERGILGALLLRNDLWRSAANSLQPDDFSLDSHRRIYTAILGLAREQGSFDTVSLAEALNSQLGQVGGTAYLSDLTSGVPARCDISGLSGIVVEKSALRRVAKQAEVLQQAALEPGAKLDACRIHVDAITATCNRSPSQRLQAYSVDDFLGLDIPPREMVLAPILPLQGLAMLYSKRGVGKTHLALGIADAVARGGTFLRWRAPEARRVLFIDGELPATTLQQRIRSIRAGVPPSEPLMPPDYLRIITPDMQKTGMPDLATTEGQLLIEREVGDATLVVLDNLSALCRSGKENEGESWLPVQGWLLRMRQQGRSVLLVHHAGKSGEQRGTSRREDVLDTVIKLHHPSDYAPREGLRCEVRYEKARGFHGEDAKAFEVRMHQEGDGEARWNTKDSEDAMLERVAALIREGTSIRNAAEELGINRSRVERLKKKAQAQGMLQEESVPVSQD